MMIYLLLYVDNMLTASKDKMKVDCIKQKLCGEFEMKDLGRAKRILGMEIMRDRKNGSLYYHRKDMCRKS